MVTSQKRSEDLTEALIEVTVNGEQHRLPANQSVLQMLGWLGMPLDRVAVELDRVIVRKRDWEQTQVRSSSNIEIVEFVGGG